MPIEGKNGNNSLTPISVLLSYRHHHLILECRLNMQIRYHQCLIPFCFELCIPIPFINEWRFQWQQYDNRMDFNINDIVFTYTICNHWCQKKVTPVHQCLFPCYYHYFLLTLMNIEEAIEEEFIDSKFLSIDMIDSISIHQWIQIANTMACW